MADIPSDGRRRAIERALIETGGMQDTMREKAAAAIVDAVDTHDREHPDEQRIRTLREAAAFLRGEYEGPDESIAAVTSPELYRPAAGSEACLPQRESVDLSRELREHMSLIERFAGVLASAKCADCEGSGMSDEGAERAPCQCVLERLESMEMSASDEVASPATVGTPEGKGGD